MFTLSSKSLAVEGLSTLNKLVETAGEIFVSLSNYSSFEENNEKELQLKVIESHEKYKKVFEELKGLITQISDFQEKKIEEEKAKENNMDTSDPIITQLIETRDSLIQESSLSIDQDYVIYIIDPSALKQSSQAEL
ncbi:4436_t:CDS:2 [Diversispora eburnea]|uniref:4436_t:CDS:1 n=1 Tax=Diversispora eburnea TaxID=1213867 RepID=A0A9N8ZT24_9GLOM|nr:4436_t:CDS:2 [Diversispora eburnea]